jgi:hypothetical protein
MHVCHLEKDLGRLVKRPAPNPVIGVPHSRLFFFFMNPNPFLGKRVWLAAFFAFWSGRWKLEPWTW